MLVGIFFGSGHVKMDFENFVPGGGGGNITC